MSPRALSIPGDLERNAGAAEETPPRRRYVPPRVEPLGDVRSLVLGASPGLGDSATNPHIHRP